MTVPNVASEASHGNCADQQLGGVNSAAAAPDLIHAMTYIDPRPPEVHLCDSRPFARQFSRCKVILTGSEIIEARRLGDIVLEPFRAEFVNPNSYNYRLADTLLIPPIDGATAEEVIIPPEGYVLAPGSLYLGSTFERIGSRRYAMSLIGRSSIGRLGLFLQVSANLGHVGSSHSWTLELVAALPIRLYPLMRIGQVSFWESVGTGPRYEGGYARYNLPQPSNWSSTLGGLLK